MVRVKIDDESTALQVHASLPAPGTGNRLAGSIRGPTWRLGHGRVIYLRSRIEQLRTLSATVSMLYVRVDLGLEKGA